MINIGLSAKHIDLITEVLKSSGASRAVLFGSRAKGDWCDSSDIDIAVFGNVRTPALLARLDELPMPYKFDVINYETINHAPLREHIDRVGVELFFRNK